MKKITQIYPPSPYYANTEPQLIKTRNGGGSTAVTKLILALCKTEKGLSRNKDSPFSVSVY
jgi:hypothetical protein